MSLASLSSLSALAPMFDLSAVLAGPTPVRDDTIQAALRAALLDTGKFTSVGIGTGPPSGSDRQHPVYLWRSRLIDQIPVESNSDDTWTDERTVEWTAALFARDSEDDNRLARLARYEAILRNALTRHDPTLGGLVDDGAIVVGRAGPPRLRSERADEPDARWDVTITVAFDVVSDAGLDESDLEIRR